MKKTRNHYDNLKVDHKASSGEIRKAYRNMASLHHPDRNGNSPKSVLSMQCINLAYEVLSDKQKRATHDAWIAQSEAASNSSAWNNELKTKKEHDGRPHEQESSHDSSAFHSSFGGYSDFMNGSSSQEEPCLKTEHRPKNFDIKHYEDFIKYNDVVREMFRGLDLAYVTTEVIYRSFLIDKQWGRGVPKNISRAYEAITRAIDRPVDTRLDKLAGLFCNRPPVAQASIVSATCLVLLVLLKYLA